MLSIMAKKILLSVGAGCCFGFGKELLNSVIFSKQRKEQAELEKALKESTEKLLDDINQSIQKEAEKQMSDYTDSIIAEQHKKFEEDIQRMNRESQEQLERAKKIMAGHQRYMDKFKAENPEFCKKYGIE